MSRADYAVGMAFFLPTIACVLAAAWLVTSRRLAHLAGAIRVLAIAVLATAILIAVHVLPAAVYLLSREAVLAAAVLAVVGAWRVPPVREVEPSGFPAPSADDGGGAGRALAAVGVGGFSVWLLVVVWQYRYHAPAGIDTLSFHLPSVARWVQSGTIWQVDNLIPDLFFGNYPNNGDVVLLATLLPWRNDFLTHFAIVPYIPLMALASYCVAREMRAPATVAALLGITVTSIPVVVEPALNNALPDAIMYTTFAAGLTFLLRYRRTGATSDLVLAGLGLGLAFGTKWYGVSSVVVVVAVWAVARWRSGVRVPAVARESAVLAGLVAAAGGVWLLRNWIFSGNPVYPQRIAPLGITIFDAAPDRLRDAVGSTIASYLDDPAVWRDTLAHQYRIAAALPGAVLLGGALAAGVVAIRRRARLHRRRPATGVVLAGCALLALLIGFYVVTPYSALGPDGMPILAGANVRYVVPALIVAVGLAGWVATRAGARTVVALQAGLLVATVDGLVISGVTDRKWVIASFAVSAAAVAAFILFGNRPRLRVPTADGRARGAIAGLALVTAVTVLVAGDRYQDRFNQLRYTAADVDPAIRWIAANAPGGNRIGLAGVWNDRGLAPVYPAHGPRLRNEVVYNGPYVKELLRRWGRRDPFVKQLDHEDLDLLLVGRGATFEQYLAGDRRLVLPEVKEERWARSAGYREILRSDRLILFRAPRSRAGLKSQHE